MLGIPELIPKLQKTSDAFLQCWLALLDGSQPPFRAAFFRSRIDNLLPMSVLYERANEKTFIIRLMGHEVIERIGIDATERNMLELISIDNRRLTQLALNTVLDLPCGHYSIVRDVLAGGREAEVEVLRLPLRDDDGATRFIGSITVPLARPRDGRGEKKPLLVTGLLDSKFFHWDQAKLA